MMLVGRGTACGVAAVSALLVLAVPDRVGAQSSDCRFEGFVLVCDGTAPGSDPSPTDPTDDTGGGTDPADDVFDGEPPATATRYTEITPSTPCAIGSRKYLAEVLDWDTNALLSSFVTCIADDPPGPTEPPPGPTRGSAVRDTEPLLELGTGLSPPPDGFGGVSQLETWFWCDNNDVVTVDVSLNGWSATASASIQSLVWSIEGPDGSIERTATSCGSEPHPESDGSAAAARWTPNLPGEYTITLTGTWTGTWTRSFGAIVETDDLGEVVVTNAPVTYEVVEIQTVGVPNP